MPETPNRPTRRVLRPSGSMAPIDQDEIEKQLALKEVMDYTVRTTRAVLAAKPMRSYRWRPIILGVVAALSVAFAAFTFIVQPAFIYGPDPAAVPKQRRDADTRMAMYLLTQRVLEHRAANQGRLPASLEDINEDWPGITYSVVNDSVFELRGRVDSATTLTLRSDERMDPFLGVSVNLIRRRRP